MKKKIAYLLGGLLGIAVAVHAATVVYSRNLVNDPGLAYSKNFDIDLKTAGTNGRSIQRFSAQAVYSSATIPSVPFTDGRVSTGTITVASVNNLLGTPATNQITVNSTSTLKNMVITINGKALRNGYDWKTKSSTITTATDIARIINFISGVDAAAVGNVVYASATTAGVAGNSFTLAVSSTGLTRAGATFSGGKDNAAVTINGVSLVQGTAWTAQSTASGTAKAISDAIMANTTLNAVLTSTWTAGGIVSATSTKVGTIYNYALTATPIASLTAFSTAFKGGTDSAYTISLPTIHSVAHGLTTALSVLYSTGSTFALGGLTNQTTYYAIKVDADNFRLSDTSTGAIAGTFLTLTSSSTVGPHTFTVAPITIAGTFGFKWQYSNDGSTFLDLAVSSVTIATPYTAGSTAWDFGIVAYRYLRLAFSAGTRGAVNLVVSGYGTNTSN